MKSKTFFSCFLILPLCFFSQKSNSQTLASVRYNADSLLYDGCNVNINYSPCNGTVSNVKGCGEIIHPGGECGNPSTSSAANPGAGVGQNDIIKVCGASMVEVTLSDGSIVRGAPGSEINMSEMDCSGGRNFSFRLLLGSLWSQVVPVMGGEQKYEVKTENATIGVRGTKFLVNVTYDTVFDNAEKTVWTVNTTTTVVFIEGFVEVGNSNGATLTDTATQVALYEDFNNKRITLEEFQRRVTEMQNNNKVSLEAGMETTVYADNPPLSPRRTRMTLEDFSPDNMINR